MIESQVTALIELAERYDAELDSAADEIAEIDSERESALERLLEEMSEVIAEGTRKSLEVMNKLADFHKQWEKESVAIEGEGMGEVFLFDDPVALLNDASLSEESALDPAREAIQELIDYEDRGPADAQQAIVQMKQSIATYVEEAQALELDEEDEDEDEEIFYECDGAGCSAESPVGTSDEDLEERAKKAGWQITPAGKTYCPKHAR